MLACQISNVYGTIQEMIIFLLGIFFRMSCAQRPRVSFEKAKSLREVRLFDPAGGRLAELWHKANWNTIWLAMTLLCFLLKKIWKVDVNAEVRLRLNKTPPLGCDQQVDAWTTVCNMPSIHKYPVCIGSLYCSNYTQVTRHDWVV